MTFVEKILGQMKSLSKPQSKFMFSCFSSFAICAGRATMTGLSRYGAGSRQRFFRWSQRPFSFFRFNFLGLECQGITTPRTAIAFDASFLPKSGKKTYGLANFYNAIQSRPQKGLEFSTVALLDLDESTAYSLYSKQTSPTILDEKTKMDHYAEVVSSQSHELLKLARHVVIDGGLARQKFVHKVRQSGLHVVGKLRHDADLRSFYQGSKKERRGRPKRYEGKVKFKELEFFESQKLEKEGLTLYSA